MRAESKSHAAGQRARRGGKGDKRDVLLCDKPDCALDLNPPAGVSELCEYAGRKA